MCIRDSVETYDAASIYLDGSVSESVIDEILGSIGISSVLHGLSIDDQQLEANVSAEIEGQLFEGSISVGLREITKDMNQNGIPDEGERDLAVQATVPIDLTLQTGNRRVVADCELIVSREAYGTFYDLSATLNMSLYENNRLVDRVEESLTDRLYLSIQSWQGVLDSQSTRLETYDLLGHYMRVDEDTLLVRGLTQHGRFIGDVTLRYNGVAYVGSYFDEVSKAGFYLSITDLEDSDSDGTPDLTDIDAQGFLYGVEGDMDGWKKLDTFGWFWGESLGTDWYFSADLDSWFWLEDGAETAFYVYLPSTGWLYTTTDTGALYRFDNGHWLAFSNVTTEGQLKYWDYETESFVLFSAN